MAIGACIGETGIHAAKLLHRFREGGLHRRLIADVAGKCMQAHAKRLQAFQGGCVFSSIATPNRNIRTRFGKGLRHAKPDAGITARDQRDLAAEIKGPISHGGQ